MILVNDLETGPGILPDLLADLHVDQITVAAEEEDPRRLLLGGGAAAPSRVDLVVALGGPQSALGVLAPWLQREVDLLRVSTRIGTRVLGICLGSQLVAHALGGTVRTGKRHFGWRWTRSLAPALLASADRFYVNTDYPVPPHGAQVLAEDEFGVLGFRKGRAFGIVSHPEVTPAMVPAFGAASDAESVMAGLAVSERATDIWEGASKLLRTVLSYECARCG